MINKNRTLSNKILVQILMAICSPILNVDIYRTGRKMSSQQDGAEQERNPSYLPSELMGYVALSVTAPCVA
jgi:hypothetical protein